MLYRITNKGEARTVTFLGVFAEGETREFTQQEIDNYQAMNGVPLYSSELADEDQFDILTVGQSEEDDNNGEEG